MSAIEASVGTVTKNSTPMPMTAVTTSMKKTGTMPNRPNTTPAAAGASSAIADWIVPKMPLTRMSCSPGTSWGRMAETAGVWTPAPIERAATATRMIHRSVTPLAISSASTSVTAAIVPSDTITSTRRFMRSASTPPKIEMMPCGRKAASA